MSFTTQITRRIALLLVSLLLVGVIGTAGNISPVANASALNSLKMYLDAPLIQASYLATDASAMTMDFDASATGPSGCDDGQPAGLTITGTCSVAAGGVYGGASTSNDTPTVTNAATQYASTVNATNPVVINLTNQSRYLGLWWSAGSPGNTMRFFKGDDLLVEVTLQDMIDLLGTGPANSSEWTARNNTNPENQVTTIGNTTNRKVWYFGNPRGYDSTTPTRFSNTTGSEPFVYLHMFLGGTMTFDRVELSGRGFEFDNLTVLEAAQTPNNRLVLVSETVQLEGVRFDSNATGVQGTMARQTGNSAAPLTTNTFTRTGYTFAGWTTSADGTGTAYADGASYPFTASTTLYAKWNLTPYTVTYDTQGGSTVVGGTYTIGSSVTMPAAPTRSGFTFAGWFTGSTGGTALGATYSPPGTGNIILYAQWTPASLSALAATGAREETGIVGFGLATFLVSLGIALMWFRRRLSL